MLFHILLDTFEQASLKEQQLLNCTSSTSESDGKLNSKLGRGKRKKFVRKLSYSESGT